jgi:two-component system heavy metal sensor histidine kinase CusS
LSGNIRNIQSDHLHVRLDPETAPVELQDLVLSFNQMIGRLEEGFVRLTNFSADIAHELRTPLTNLITQTQVGLSKARDQSEYRELLYSNLEEQERLATMVSDMLWLAQADHGLVKPEFATLDLAVEVQDSIEYLTAWAEESQVRLAVQGEGQLVKGDRAMLRRALLNLLANAISHTPAGGLVTIRLDPPANGLVRLAVENTGETIPAEHLSKIFDRFYRIDPSRQRHKEGVGLGLAIVHSIIAVHGGQVEARSSAGLTIFTLTLPALVAAE